MVVGWGANVLEQRRADRIVLFVDGDFVLTALIGEKVGSGRGPGHGAGPPRLSGFSFLEPFSKTRGAAEVRLFAVAGGLAGELGYDRNLDWQAGRENG